MSREITPQIDRKYNIPHLVAISTQKWHQDEITVPLSIA